MGTSAPRQQAQPKRAICSNSRRLSWPCAMSTCPLSPVSALSVISSPNTQTPRRSWSPPWMSRDCALIAARLGWANERCELIRLASMMHDIGKIGTPDEIVFKPGGFTPDESRLMQQHTEIGRRLLSGSAELLTVGATIAWTHHEQFDGSGYPRGLVGEAIPLEGRIAAIADAFDAITTRRVYKQALPVEQAADVMRLGRARHFDPQLLKLFLDSIDKVLVIRRQYPDVERSPAS